MVCLLCKCSLVAASSFVCMLENSQHAKKKKLVAETGNKASVSVHIVTCTQTP